AVAKKELWDRFCGAFPAAERSGYAAILDSRLAYRLEAGPAAEVLHLEGDVTRTVARELAELLAAPRSIPLTVDLSQVTAMDSAAVAVLVNGWRRSRAGLVLGPTSPGADQALTLFRVGAESVPPGKSETL